MPFAGRRLVRGRKVSRPSSPVLTQPRHVGMTSRTNHGRWSGSPLSTITNEQMLFMLRRFLRVRSGFPKILTRGSVHLDFDTVVSDCTAVEIPCFVIQFGRVEDLRRFGATGNYFADEAAHWNVCCLSIFEMRESLENVNLCGLLITTPQAIATKTRTPSWNRSWRTSTLADADLWARSEISSRKHSASPHWMSNGGRPWKSPNRGLAYGCVRCFSRPSLPR